MAVLNDILQGGSRNHLTDKLNCLRFEKGLLTLDLFFIQLSMLFTNLSLGMHT